MDGGELDAGRCSCAALVAGLLVTGSTPSQRRRRDRARPLGEAESLRRSESAALLELYAAEAVARAARRPIWSASTARSAELALDGARQHDGTRRRSFAARSRASQMRIASLLRDLYVQGEPDPIAIILGATSLDEAMAGIDGLARATALNERLAASRPTHGPAGSAQVRGISPLAGASLSTAPARERRAPSGASPRPSSARRATVATIRRQRALTAQRLTTLAGSAQRGRAALGEDHGRRGDASADADRPVSCGRRAAGATADAAPSGTRTLVVDAVAYHLPGSTASGLPVGVGVIAVDPSVIPLGTRVLRPGLRPRGRRRRRHVR